MLLKFLRIEPSCLAMDCSEIHLKFTEHGKDVIYSNPPLIKLEFDYLKYLFFPTNKINLKRFSKISVEL